MLTHYYYYIIGERKNRPRGDRKSIEMTLHMQQTFEAAIMTQLYPKSQIDIFVEVMIYIHHYSSLLGVILL